MRAWRTPPVQQLRFSPTAWAKLLCLRDLGDTEVGGFGIAAEDDLLLIEDVRLVRQTCTAVTVAFDDASVADFFDEQVDRGYKLERFARIWVHTHPGESAWPSYTDEETFERVFARSEWAVMFILAQGGQTYCRLRFNVGPGGEMELPVVIDYSRPFAASDHEAWQAEYANTVEEEPLIVRAATLSASRRDTQSPLRRYNVEEAAIIEEEASAEEELAQYLVEAGYNEEGWFNECSE
jgi:proteasome lid subunit RPN8/RPN11